MRTYFKRPCDESKGGCGKMFQPTGKFQRLCDKCRYTSSRSKLEKSYFRHKKQLDELRDNITLRRWKILSIAYKKGKNIWGSSFTRQRLAFDMDMPLTTVLRCLSLDKANKRSWKLVNEKKLSIFKLAMICLSKNVTFQDEIVDIVIEDKLSTYNISKLKINNIKDINKERQRVACETGYSRRNSAFYNFSNTIDRIKVFLLMDKKHLPENKIKDIEKKLIKLNKDINNYLK